MAQSAASLAAVMKDGWSSDTLVKQFESGNTPFSEFKKFKGKPIGLQTQVPIHSGRSFAYTGVSAAGGSLNPAQQQSVAQATYTTPYHWFQISLETSAVMQAKGGDSSVIDAKDLEIENAIENVQHQLCRQIATNGDGVLAACATSASSTTVSLLPATSEGANYGYQALVRGWIAPGATVDIGTLADTDALATGVTVLSVNLSPAAPSFTVASPIATTSGTHFVFIPNPNSTTAANPEMNGLRQIVSSSGALGGLNPATAGQEYWQAAYRDTTTSVLSLELFLAMERAIRQNGAQKPDIWTGLKQQAALYSILQNQVRFSSDGDLSAGGVESASWNGKRLKAFADFLDTDLFMLNLPDIVRVVTPGADKPQWVGEIQGTALATQWTANQTAFGDACVWPVNLAAHRRNTHAAATALQ